MCLLFIDDKNSPVQWNFLNDSSIIYTRFLQFFQAKGKMLLRTTPFEKNIQED